MLSRHRAIADDGGFTLVELLLVIVVIGVIMVPLADVVLGALRQTDQSAGRLAESHDAQLSAAYFAADVASLGTRSTVDPLNPVLQTSIETNMAYNAGTFPCGTAGTPTAAVRFAWDDATSPTTTTIVTVAYVAVPAGPRFELHRLRCNGTALVSDLTLGRDLTAAPIVLCEGNPCAGGAPRTVTMRLSIQDVRSREGAYTITLNGNRRQE